MEHTNIAELFTWNKQNIVKNWYLPGTSIVVMSSGVSKKSTLLLWNVLL